MWATPPMIALKAWQKDACVANKALLVAKNFKKAWFLPGLVQEATYSYYLGLRDTDPEPFTALFHLMFLPMHVLGI
ncbi:hypothetical protein PCANC_14053 [Puccinia coronata f. sp. avenae]|uniref:Uncharacterized protein n=1 Tax=Puccinia coronata f. sp. avenae TaxID=200324 RepID=A0A2N5VRI5_9BASI|nr:hypothetical protein PCANC_14053 [Puccinia coronata f. sp. avenae]